MALLRLLCSPSTTSFVTQQQSQYQSSVCCCSSPLSLSTASSFSCLSYTTPIKTRKPTSIFAFHVSCSSSTSSATVSIESPELKEEEETSRTKLIAQNVPWSSNADDIRELFGKHGTVVDVELSMHNKTRNRGLAFVTMGSPEEARAALENLQSFEFEDRTLYINYARPQKKKSSPPEQPKTSSVYNLFVANLSYEARSKDLREFFQGGGWKVYTAEVIFHENPRKASGYGFVSFTSKEDANAALSTFQGKMLMGRPIRLARSKRFSRHETKASDPEDVSTESNPQQVDNVDEI